MSSSKTFKALYLRTSQLLCYNLTFKEAHFLVLGSAFGPVYSLTPTTFTTFSFFYPLTQTPPLLDTISQSLPANFHWMLDCYASHWVLWIQKWIKCRPWSHEVTAEYTYFFLIFFYVCLFCVILQWPSISYPHFHNFSASTAVSMMTSLTTVDVSLFPSLCLKVFHLHLSIFPNVSPEKRCTKP